MSGLAISLLGPFQVARDGEPVTGFQSGTARALLAYLALHAGVPCPRETLAGLLWPEQPDAEALRNLRVALSRLRKAIGDRPRSGDRETEPPYLHITRQALQFNREGDYWLDVEAFNDALTEIQAHRHRRLSSCELCLDRLQEAAALYRGDLLDGFSVDSAPYEEWLVLEREALHQQALDALDRLATAHLERGAYERAVECARRQVELEPWRESAYRQWMLALALSGQRAEALARYETCRRVLDAELGVEPEEETAALYRRIRDGAELQPPSPTAPHNLPAQPIPFVGRKAELAQLEEMLQAPDVRLVTVVGAGGMGKTRLALEAARAQLDRYEDGVYLVSLAPLRSAETLVPAVAAAVGLTFYPGGDPRQQLLGFLRRKHMLLVFDNFEHLLPPAPVRTLDRYGGERHSDGAGGADLVSDILQTAPEVVVLATSRARLNLQGEQRFHLEGMDTPEALPPAAVGRPEDATDPEGWTAYSAVHLFVQSARRADPGFALEAETLRDVVHICRLVGGMPLGILLAASWMEMLRAQEIATEIEQSLDFLESDLRDLPERQRSMRAVYNHSWNLLSAREREVLQALSVFRGGFTRGAAQQVTGATLRELRTLANRSLLHREPSGRYGMHELLRQYAEEKLHAEPGQDKAVHDSHSAFYLSALAQWGADLRGPRQRAAMAEIEADLDNVRAAWEWAADPERSDQGWPDAVRSERLLQAMDGLCDFFSWHRRYKEGAVMCAATATAVTTALRAGSMPAALHLRGRVQARALAWQSHFAEKMGDIETASRLADRSLALLDRLDASSGSGQSTVCCRPERALALRSKAICLWQTNIEQTRRLLERSLDLYRALGDRWSTGRTLLALGAVAWWRSKLQQSRQLAQESLDTFRSLGDRWGSADALCDLGDLAIHGGRMDEAESLMRQALAEAEGSRGWEDRGITLGWVYLCGGKFTRALQGFEKDVALYSELGLQMRLVRAQTHLAECCFHLGGYERACSLAQDNLERCVNAGYRLYTAIALEPVARVALVQDRPLEAQRHLREGVQISRETASGGLLASNLTHLGFVELVLGHRAEAKECLVEALQITVEGRHWWRPADILACVALLFADEGQIERAVEFYALAVCYPEIANSRWFEDVVGRHITAAAATLPPEVVAAARERGRGRDLWETATELLEELGKRS